MTDQNGTHETKGITGITVSGFKSLRDESHIEVRPLTILAGANSSGKSSIMQPLLLMKQTLEAPYDPGALLLNGPNVRFTSAEQFLWKTKNNYSEFHVAVENSHIQGFLNIFRKEQKKSQIQVVETTTYHEEIRQSLKLGMTQREIERALPPVAMGFKREWELNLSGDLRWIVKPKRCFLGVDMVSGEDETSSSEGMGIILDVDDRYLIQLIHVSGLRPNPERTYPYTSVNYYNYPGIFENYTASVIADWQSNENERLSELEANLMRLGLTTAISATQANETQIEVRVGRTFTSSRDDLVSIADVGFGVSQALPVLVALLEAKSGQLVYIEQPELHLHPKAQVALAQVLADAAKRGVRVVAETHSDLLLLGIQTLVAEGKLAPDLVKLHWFDRGEDGATTITSADLDEDGAYGNWPENFADVDLEAQKRYLDASAVRNLGT